MHEQGADSWNLEACFADCAGSVNLGVKEVPDKLEELARDVFAFWSFGTNQSCEIHPLYLRNGNLTLLTLSLTTENAPVAVAVKRRPRLGRAGESAVYRDGNEQRRNFL